MLFIFPNLNVYSSLGSYTTKSQGLKANREFYIRKNERGDRPFWPALGWAAVGLVAGTAVDHYAHDEVESAWNYIDSSIANFGYGARTITSRGIQNKNDIGWISAEKKPDLDYGKYDFSKFDN